jgi:hypothetical protein
LICHAGTSSSSLLRLSKSDISCSDESVRLMINLLSNLPCPATNTHFLSFQKFPSPQAYDERSHLRVISPQEARSQTRTPRRGLARPCCPTAALASRARSTLSQGHSDFEDSSPSRHGGPHAAARIPPRSSSSTLWLHRHEHK